MNPNHDEKGRFAAAAANAVQWEKSHGAKNPVRKAEQHHRMLAKTMKDANRGIARSLADIAHGYGTNAKGSPGEKQQISRLREAIRSNAQSQIINTRIANAIVKISGR